MSDHDARLRFDAALEALRAALRDLDGTRFEDPIVDALIPMRRFRERLEAEEAKHTSASLARRAKGKIEVLKRERDRSGVNASKAWSEKTEAWLRGLGVPSQEARKHNYGHTIEVKRFGEAVYVRHRYVYRCYPGATEDPSYRRAFIVRGEVIASIEGARRDNAWYGYETDGRGSIEAGSSMEHQWCDGDGARDFDRVALHALRRMAAEGLSYAQLFDEEGES